MYSWLKSIASIFLLTVAAVASALDIGDDAPKFTTPAALAGEVSTYSLATHLSKGPVVLYFFPMAFSQGCSEEANSFANAVDDFKSLGATVVGVSRDEIETLKKFSVSQCRGKFAVASDIDQTIMKAYDAVLFSRSEYANRVSFVISPEGKVIYQYKSLNPDKHVANTMAALKSWRQHGVVK